MTTNNIQQANLVLSETIADFLCFMDNDGGAVNEEHFESNLLVTDLLLQSLGLEIIEADSKGKMTVKIDIGLDLSKLAD